MTVKIMARLTQMNHRRSVQPALARCRADPFLMRRLESVPDVDEEREKSACSALPHMY